MSRRTTGHIHLTHMIGRGGVITRQPEVISVGDAAHRLLDEIAARYVEKGCRVVKYYDGIRIYDCKNAAIADQSFEVRFCGDEQCDTTASELEYGRWTKADRQKYLRVLEQRGLIA